MEILVKTVRCGLSETRGLAVKLALTSYFACVLGTLGLRAEPRDLTALSLEELMNIRLTATSVMGIHHTHPKGEWMFGYTSMRMRMAGNRAGTAEVSDRKVLGDFMVTPTSMDMDMHMFGLMYAPVEDFTIMAMVPALRLSMDHLTRKGARFTTQSAGIGDISVTGLYTFYKGEQSRLHLDFGASIPTGSIDATDDTPTGSDQTLPYPMQLGIGTFALKPAVTYFSQTQRWNWGGHVGTSLPVGRNRNGYRVGNRYVFDGWMTRRWTDWISTSVRVMTTVWGDIRGADPRLNPRLVPTADPNLRGGEKVDLRLGLAFYVPQSDLSGNRLSIEFTLPTYQSLHGPQLESDWGLNLGWTYAWRFSQ